MFKDRLTPITDLSARQSVIKAEIDRLVGKMPDGSIKNSWQAGALRTDTKNVIKRGVALAVGASTRRELFTAIPQQNLLNRDRPDSKKDPDEVAQNLKLQDELDTLRRGKDTLTYRERVRLAVILAQLDLTATGQETNPTQTLQDRLMFINIVGRAIAKSAIAEFHQDQPEEQASAEPNPDKPADRRDIMSEIDGLLEPQQ